MTTTPRHRREHVVPPLLSYEPPVPVRNIDFDAVAPMRRAPEQTSRESRATPATTPDSMKLARTR